MFEEPSEDGGHPGGATRGDHPGGTTQEGPPAPSSGGWATRKSWGQELLLFM